MKADPIVLIIVALAALVAGLVYAYNHSEAFRRIVQAAFHAVEQAGQSKWRTLQSISNSVVGAASAAGRGIESAWRLVASITTSIFDGIRNFFAKWWPLLLVIFLPFVAIIVAIWNHWHEQIIGTAKAAWSAVSSFFVGTWRFISGAAETAWSFTQHVIIQPMRELYDDLVSLWRRALAWLDGIWRQVASAASAAWGLVYEYTISPIVRLYDDVTGWFDRIKKSVGDALSSAWKSASNIGSQFLDVGKNIVMGIVHGVEDGGRFLIDKLKNLASSALNAAKSFLGISSPSRVFAAEVGQWIPRGIAQGVDDHGRVAVDSVTGLANGLTGKFAAGGAQGLSTAGGLGAGAGGTTVVLNVTVQGSVLSENDLRDVLERQMLQLGMRNSTTWQNYARR
jgi:phage-related protein